MLATVVIPVSPEHYETGIYQEALASVTAQTIPTKSILIIDHDKRGAAWARNQGTAQVKTPFVIWLDADDLLMPDFVERTVSAYRKGAFVYTDWRLHGKDMIVPPTLNPLGEGQEHVITTLMPVAAWQAVGGFDETLDSLEDEDYYRKLAAYGWYGVKANGVLIDYRRNRGFSKVNLEAVDPDIAKKRITEKTRLFTKRYDRYKAMYMYFSEQRKKKAPDAVGERKPNDVLCEAMYSPMTQVGGITKRKYPRAGLNEPIWIDHDDALARPDLWRIVAQNPDTVSPDVQRVTELYQRAVAEKQARDSIKTVEAISPVTNGYAAMSMDELRAELAKHDMTTDELTGGVSVHWKVARKAILSFLEAQDA